MSNVTHHSRVGFTLIEMIVVMTIVALLTGMAVMKFREPYLAANFETTIRHIAALDELTRNRATRSTDVTSITIDSEQGWMHGTAGSQVQLNSAITITQIVFDDASNKKGRITIPISLNGQSPTYGLHIHGAGDREAWLVFIGLTGQMVRIDGKGDNDALLQTFWPKRPDAA